MKNFVCELFLGIATVTVKLHVSYLLSFYLFIKLVYFSLFFKKLFESCSTRLQLNVLCASLSIC